MWGKVGHISGERKGHKDLERIILKSRKGFGYGIRKSNARPSNTAGTGKKEKGKPDYHVDAGLGRDTVRDKNNTAAAMALQAAFGRINKLIVHAHRATP